MYLCSIDYLAQCTYVAGISLNKKATAKNGLYWTACNMEFLNDLSRGTTILVKVLTIWAFRTEFHNK